jgi:dihydropteroate synthase
MGIVNVTPDSFSDGGLFIAPEAALAQALKLAADGADIVDVGAESTRPGHTPVSAQEEWRRLEPVLSELIARAGVPVSVDTYKAETARRALECGAALINDVWGLQRDPQMAEVVAGSQAGVVIMHNRETADAEIDILEDMRRFFEKSLEIARRGGIDESRVMLDPGIGFGKTRAQNYAALKALPDLLGIGFPILVGVSRKSLFRDMPDGLLEGRLIATIAANLFAASCGANVFRVHDVVEHRAAFEVLRQIGGAGA